MAFIACVDDVIALFEFPSGLRAFWRANGPVGYHGAFPTCPGPLTTLRTRLQPPTKGYSPVTEPNLLLRSSGLEGLPALEGPVKVGLSTSQES